jgi:S1-C subfamily serine protease
MRKLLTTVAFFVASCASVGARSVPAGPQSEAQRFQYLMEGTVRVDTAEGFGSGTVVWVGDGQFLVLTCAHVVHEIGGVAPTDTGLFVESPYLGKLSAHVEKYDDDQDLTLLLVRGKTLHPAHALKIADKEPELYARVYLLGSPLAQYGALSEGFLSDLRSSWASGAERYYVTGGFILFGISGGTALNEKGELIGVPEAVRSLGGYQVLPQAGYCVSLPTIKRFLRGYLYAA